MTLRDTADQIIRASLRAVQPDAAVQLTKTPMEPDEVARLKALALADAAAAVEMAR